MSISSTYLLAAAKDKDIVRELCQIVKTDKSGLAEACRKLISEREEIEQTKKIITKNLMLIEEMRKSAEQSILSEQEMAQKIRKTMAKSATEHSESIIKRAERDAKKTVEKAEEEAKQIVDEAIKRAQIRSRELEIRQAELEAALKNLEKYFEVHPVFKNSELIEFCVNSECVKIDKNALLLRFGSSVLTANIVSGVGKVKREMEKKPIDLGPLNPKIFKIIVLAIHEPNGIISDFSSMEKSDLEQLDSMLEFLHIGRRGYRLFNLPVNEQKNFLVQVGDKEMPFREYWQLDDEVAIDALNLDTDEYFSFIVSEIFKEFFLKIEVKEQSKISLDKKSAIVYLALQKVIKAAHKAQIKQLKECGVIKDKEEAHLPFKRWDSALADLLGSTRLNLDAKANMQISAFSSLWLHAHVHQFNVDSCRYYDDFTNMMLSDLKKFFVYNAKYLLGELFVLVKASPISIKDDTRDNLQLLMEIDSSLDALIKPWLMVIERLN